MWIANLKSVKALSLVVAMCAGAACTEKAAEATKNKVGAALDATKAGADKAIDATKAATDKTAEAAQKTADKTSEAVNKAADKVTDTAKGAATVTGNAVTDAWITTKLKAKFGDETVLKGSDIAIKTSAHVVTLTGTVGSELAKERAGQIALGTPGVVDLVNQLSIK